jgi:topoisomerase-4 subunit A
VLQRRSRHRLAAIERRLELLSGFLIAYLNLDEVIRIIREEDEPKLELMKTFELTDVQAEAILNMRLRSLRKLEELEIRKEFDGLTNGEGGDRGLLASDAKQWQTVAWEIGNVRKTFSKETELGARRTKFAEAPVADLAAIEQAMIEKEPITVVISEKGWIRGMKGHLADFAGLQFKDGDAQARLPRQHHRQAGDRHHRRQGLHSGRRQAARRPWAWRTAQDHGRHGQ